jgi:hydrogenase maturation protease
VKRPLVIGYGNPLRQDDGIGRRAAQLLEHQVAPGTVEILQCRQLTPELAAKLARASTIVFLDAALDRGASGVLCLRVAPVSWGAWSHHLSPGQLVGLIERLAGAAPPSFLITGAIRRMEFGEGLTATGEQTAARMAVMALELLRE